jgi:AcrR family transcriptional regulator
MTPENNMRRSPQQARGQRRVTIILDAASEVFSEIGYEAATTNAIAIRANTSIGSLYQFFPNKFAILDALAQRFRAQLDETLNLDFSNITSVQEPLTALIDVVTRYYTSYPAFRPIFYASQSSQALTRVADETCTVLVERVSKLFSVAVPKLNTIERDFYAKIIVFMMRSLIPLSLSQTETERERIIPELKRMMFAYLASLDAFSDYKFTFV